MEIILHWIVPTKNFVNKGDCSLGAKYKIGQKPGSINQRLTLRVNRERIDLKWKKIVEAMLIKNSPAIRSNLSVQVYTDKLYILSASNLKNLSNNLANVMLLHRGYTDKAALDKRITASKLGVQIGI